MIDFTETRGNYIWPKTDTRCYNYMMTHFDLPEQICKFVSDKKVCVQAGGNMGVYTKMYAEKFQHVYTFEPEPLNFYCLNQNVTEPNVFKYQSCIGKDRKLVNLKIKEANRGKTHVSKTGSIPTLQIDDLGLNVCSLIHLDIEGFELFALQGAIQTIRTCKPVVVIEYFEKNAVRYGWTLEQLESLLKQHGYKFEHNIEEERIYIPA